jgi:hypothetical protein
MQTEFRLATRPKRREDGTMTIRRRKAPDRGGLAVHAIKEARKNRNPTRPGGTAAGAIGGLHELACDYERSHLRSDARAGT